MAEVVSQNITENGPMSRPGDCSGQSNCSDRHEDGYIGRILAALTNQNRNFQKLDGPNNNVAQCTRLIFLSMVM